MKTQDFLNEYLLTELYCTYDWRLLGKPTLSGLICSRSVLCGLSRKGMSDHHRMDRHQRSENREEHYPAESCSSHTDLEAELHLTCSFGLDTGTNPCRQAPKVYGLGHF